MASALLSASQALQNALMMAHRGEEGKTLSKRIAAFRLRGPDYSGITTTVSFDGELETAQHQLSTARRPP